MKSVNEIGHALVDHCRKGENAQAIAAFYSPDIVSVEAVSMPGFPAEVRGVDAVLAKNRAWVESHHVHEAAVHGPFPHGDRFAVLFTYDITNKQTNLRNKMEEVALFTVENGKIVREEFFYQTG